MALPNIIQLELVLSLIFAQELLVSIRITEECEDAFPHCKVEFHVQQSPWLFLQSFAYCLEHLGGLPEIYGQHSKRDVIDILARMMIHHLHGSLEITVLETLRHNKLHLEAYPTPQGWRAVHPAQTLWMQYRTPLNC